MRKVLIGLLLLFSQMAIGQVRWTGMGGNTLWNDPLNWESAMVPGPEDDVLLDNSLQPLSFNILLPDLSVTIKSLRIVAADGKQIVVVLPVTNMVSSPAGSTIPRAFNTTGNGYTLDIGSGGVFNNGSGSTGGYSISIKDSIRLMNGGKYTHKTRTGHAELVQQLGKTTGTETGIFRFENTDAASTISLSGRIFGTLQFGANSAPAGICTYTAAGTNKLIIRGNLELEQGVNLTINMQDTITVNKDLLIDNANFNLSSNSRSVVLQVDGNWIQSGGKIFESNLSGATGTIYLAGINSQQVNCTGIIADSVRVVVNTGTEINLMADLSLPYFFQLTNGVLRSGANAKLVLLKNATIQFDSTFISSFVDMPIKKEGLQNTDFSFPVGSNGILRWMALKNATGDFIIDHSFGNAYDLGFLLEPGLDHISQVEYWSVSSSANSSGSVELSFDNVHSGGVSDLPGLRVAGFNGTMWKNFGNVSTKGDVLSGTVTSVPISSFQELNNVTLASAFMNINVLPIVIEKQWMEKTANGWAFRWKTGVEFEKAMFSIKYSERGSSYSKISSIPAVRSKKQYEYNLPGYFKNGYCKLSIEYANGKVEEMGALRFGNARSESNGKIRIYRSGSNIYLNSPDQKTVWVEIYDLRGNQIYRSYSQVPAVADFQIPILFKIPSGIYIIKISNHELNQVQKLFIQ